MLNQAQSKVWDPVVRIFHWSLVGAMTIAFVTDDDLMTLHVLVGCIVLALLGIRVIWGLIGIRYAWFTNFVHSPSRVMA